MLTKLERKVLRSCNKCPLGVLNTSDIQRHAPELSDSDIAQCCTHLDTAGYFEVFSLDMAGKAHLVLNYKGQHYREFSWNKIKEFILKSIFVPIGVSVITTILLNILF